MKIKELIKKGGMTSSMVEKVKTYNEEVDIPIKQFVDIIDSSVMFKKMQGFFNLKDVLDIFDSSELVMMYTTIAETSEVMLFKCTKDGQNYTIASSIAVDRRSKGKDKLTGKVVRSLKSNMMDRDVSHFGLYDFQLGFSANTLEESVEMIAALGDVQVEEVKTKTGREYKLGLIVQTKQGLDLNVQNIEYDSTLDDVDMLYENVDAEYLETLLEAIHTKKKGNIIFSGIPGTGKTYFIRKIIKDYYDKYESDEKEDTEYDDGTDELLALLRDRRDRGTQKLFLYVPVNLAHVFSNPEFVSLLQNAATEYPKGIVIILEDAEKVLESREKEGSNYAVTELLEMSDGMLNDIVSTQFIFTYNTATDNIDKALLRPGRLLALKEFKKLSPEKANVLAKELNIPMTYDKDVTIAEVFKELAIEEETILIDTAEKEKTKIGF